MLSAICFSLDQSKISLSSIGLSIYHKLQSFNHQRRKLLETMWKNMEMPVNKAICLLIQHYVQ